MGEMSHEQLVSSNTIFWLMASIFKVSAFLPALSQVGHVIRTWNTLVIIYRKTKKLAEKWNTSKLVSLSREDNEEIKLILILGQLG